MTREYLVTHPGRVIRAMLDERSMTQQQLAGLCRITTKHLSHLVTGKAPLSARVAVDIELALGVWCAGALMRMQADYDVANARAQRERALDERFGVA